MIEIVEPLGHAVGWVGLCMYRVGSTGGCLPLGSTVPPVAITTAITTTTTRGQRYGVGVLMVRTLDHLARVTPTPISIMTIILTVTVVPTGEGCALRLSVELRPSALRVEPWGERHELAPCVLPRAIPLEGLSLWSGARLHGHTSGCSTETQPVVLPVDRNPRSDR